MCPPRYATPLCLLSLLGLLCLASAQLDNCSKDPATLLCRGERAMRNVLRNLSKSDKPLVIMRGLEIVPLPNEVEAPPTAAPNADADATLLDSLSTYLRTHELNLKLADLLDEASPSEARKKDKGQGLLLAMALMFGKMMAVLGLGGIGALAMKALGVAMVALMMAGILGLKAASQQGHESSHSISYVTGEGHHHKRRRRATNIVQEQQQEQQEQQPQRLAYRAWLR
ncbi:PREDICTED: uncharacterized protein LOC108613170 [Drosophila arizonae]|uniref:Uncharacterized protein LOC108613170 n=1 Tax=Drosophila arizonae TaxID=7263 RepID=A0ABM1P445_DROAR|nr:PREDICTED: uncharacterized protein LOC108613170 [Drosophila arizonae]